MQTGDREKVAGDVSCWKIVGSALRRPSAGRGEGGEEKIIFDHFFQKLLFFHFSVV